MEAVDDLCSALRGARACSDGVDCIMGDSDASIGDAGAGSVPRKRRRTEPEGGPDVLSMLQQLRGVCDSGSPKPPVAAAFVVLQAPVRSPAAVCVSRWLCRTVRVCQTTCLQPLRPLLPRVWRCFVVSAALPCTWQYVR
jgi:hypothetical protein